MLKCIEIWDEPKKCKNKCCFLCEKLDKCEKKDLQCKNYNIYNFLECKKIEKTE